MGLQGGHVPTAIPRRATLSDEVHRENRIKSLLRFDQDSPTKASRDVRFRIRSIETYTYTPIRAWIAIL